MIKKLSLTLLKKHLIEIKFNIDTFLVSSRK
jgi:hypothetical protein